MIWSQMPDGLAKKKGSITAVRAPISQPARPTTRMARRRVITVMRRRFSAAWARRSISLLLLGSGRAVLRAAPVLTSVWTVMSAAPFRLRSVAAGHGALVADLHFLAQGIPDGAGDIDAPLVVADFAHHARPRQKIGRAHV